MAVASLIIIHGQDHLDRDFLRIITEPLTKVFSPGRTLPTAVWKEIRTETEKYFNLPAPGRGCQSCQGWGWLLATAGLVSRAQAAASQ